ncbi:MAG: DNA polymerase III subunit delta [Treponema sp.]|nr:DNA polymerase III subunit delta [Treponema sp.]
MAANPPLYLYTGPEFGERNDAVDAVKNAFKKEFGLVDEHVFYLLETPFNQVMTILQSGTLFSDGVLVVCKSAELLKKKDDIQMLSDWLKNAEASSLLILVSDEVTVDSKVEKLVPAANRKKFWTMFEDKKLPWLQNFFRKNGYRIQQSAAELILELVENNTQALKDECSRFFVCFPKEHEITEADVESILTHNREETAFSLFAQIADSSENAQTRFEKGLSILQRIRLSKDNSSVMIIAGLASCFRNLVRWHNEGESAIHGTMLQKQYRSAARVWTVGQATAALAILASTDMEIRSGGTQLEDILLQKMLYEIVIKKGAQIQTRVPDYSEDF